MSATLNAPSAQSDRRRLVSNRIASSNAVTTRFFEDNADSVARACQAMAARFRTGGRLLVVGDAAQRSDVAHVVVEFVHPVLVGKRALPAIALRDASELETIGRAGDILMLLNAGALNASDARTLGRARSRGLLTLALSGATSAGRIDADLSFAVGTTDPCIAQEAHEMLYHVLWELVHVFLDHHG